MAGIDVPLRFGERLLWIVFVGPDRGMIKALSQLPLSPAKLSATMCYMERIGLRELRQHASRYITRVAQGETVEVTQRGRLVARIVPAVEDPWKDLILRGEVLPATSSKDLLDVTAIDCGFDASAALQQLRADER